MLPKTIAPMMSRRLTIVTLAFLLGPALAYAQDASAWDKQRNSEARLIAGARVDVAGKAGLPYLRAGLELQLDPGWKTYWRYPGDSGIPPTFDFSGSANVKSVTVEWPAPQRFPDGAGGNSIGYVGDVILPLRVFQVDPAKPTVLRLKLGYDVCANMCVPADANLELALSGNGAADAAIKSAQQRVPVRIDTAPDCCLAVKSAHREPGGGHERVTVEVDAPKDAAIDLFAEGPTPEWSLPLPEPTGGDDNTARRRFTFDLDGLPPGAVAKGATLTFTLVWRDHSAIEVPIRLD
jgi:DsbC/DsbD-like thiol-disulfide interchange protein